MYKYQSVKEQIRHELENGSYDLIHVETYYIMPNIPETSVPVLLAEQTIEYLVYQHYTETTSFWPLKPFLYIDVAKHKYWEKYYWQKARKVAAMSLADKKKMLELVPNLDVDIVPNGVDIDHFKKTVVPQKEGMKFLFVGNFNWLQNREAVEMLVRKIWPMIKAQLPEASLWIAGRSPTTKIKSFANSDIIVSEDIEDIRTAYQGASVLIAPLYGSGGTRYKILEAMASNLPVVSTQIGIEGIGAKNNVHALISNDPVQLANLAVKVTRDKPLARKISSNANKLVKDHYDWEVVSAKLDKIYEEIAKKN